MTATTPNRRAWLLMSNDPTRGGYSDLLGEHYSWTERVQNAREPRVGDTIVVWDGAAILGVSVIEDIVEEQYQCMSLQLAIRRLMTTLTR